MYLKSNSYYYSTHDIDKDVADYVEKWFGTANIMKEKEKGHYLLRYTKNNHFDELR